jgi:hypothetical protein
MRTLSFERHVDQPMRCLLSRPDENGAVVRKRIARVVEV